MVSRYSKLIFIDKDYMKCIKCNIDKSYIYYIYNDKINNICDKCINRSRKFNGKNELKNVDDIIDAMNNNTVIGKKLTKYFYNLTGLKIKMVCNRENHNRKCHYDFIIVDINNNKYKIEYKASFKYRKISSLDKPWKSGVQFANVGAEQFNITINYAKLWYDEYIGNGYLKNLFKLESSIPSFNSWYKSDCCSQGNPKTLFGIELKNYYKREYNSSLLSLRSNINKKMLETVLNNKIIMDEFYITVTDMANKFLSQKDYWLQLNGDINEKVSFKWYSKLTLSNIINTSISIKSDIDIIIEYEEMTICCKLRWGKGAGFSNLRIDFK